MAALTDYQRNTLENQFTLVDFVSMWPIIDEVYKRLGLGELLSDDERIAEYKYINEQLRKFVFKQREPVMSHGGDLDGMLNEVTELAGRIQEYGDERKKLVYGALRDQWVIGLHGAIMALMSDDGEEE